MFEEEKLAARNGTALTEVGEHVHMVRLLQNNVDSKPFFGARKIVVDRVLDLHMVNRGSISTADFPLPDQC